MVGLAAVCWAIWKARNSVCFDKKIIRSPTEIICSASLFLIYWAELQKEEDRMKLEEGAEALKVAAPHYHPQEAPADDTGTVLLQ
uniref:Uncharacterized protein n=1 Tax=Setaria viridis TaxID=4556 RepID=A0A4U6VT14_SETVI|nr:hypothetical protein SEVIR_2G206300v2 [Setaria viridis]